MAEYTRNSLPLVSNIPNAFLDVAQLILIRAYFGNSDFNENDIRNPVLKGNNIGIKELHIDHSTMTYLVADLEELGYLSKRDGKFQLEERGYNHLGAKLIQIKPLSKFEKIKTERVRLGKLERTASLAAVE